MMIVVESLKQRSSITRVTINEVCENRDSWFQMSLMWNKIVKVHSK